MRKILMVTCGILMMSSVVLAQEVETCANGAGTVVVGVVTGHKYCMSNKTMNWWNAVSWCDGQGKRLFDRSDCACDSEKADCVNNLCPDLKNGIDRGVWIGTAVDSTRSYYIQMWYGVLRDYENRSSLFYAMCK